MRTSKKRAEIIDRFGVRLACIDDFAFRKGQRYGSVLVDIETRKVVDILNSREYDDVKQWLDGFPNLEIVSRDGSIITATSVTNSSGSYYGGKTETVSSSINNYQKSSSLIKPVTNGAGQTNQNKVVNYLKDQIRDTSQTIKLTGLGTDMNPKNDDDFLTMNVGKTTTTLYDLDAAGRATGQQSTIKVIDFGLFNDFIQVDVGVDTQYLVAEGGAGAEVNNLGFEAAGGGYATYFEGGIIPEIKIGKLGIKGRVYVLGGGDGAYLKGGINYNDSDGRKHLFNAEGVLEYFGGLKLNLDFYWK